MRVINIDLKLSTLTSALRAQDGGTNLIEELLRKQEETATVLEKIAEEQRRQGRAFERLLGRDDASEETRRALAQEFQHSHTYGVDDKEKFALRHLEAHQTPDGAAVITNIVPTNSNGAILLNSESSNLRIAETRSDTSSVVPVRPHKKKRTFRDTQSEDEEVLQHEPMAPCLRTSRWTGAKRSLFDSYSEKSSAGGKARNEDAVVKGPIKFVKEESDASPQIVDRTMEKRRLLESDDEEELWAGME
ncbi:hypothetical protein BDD12DRAFT_802111 [Trichophaea hybrida]|nr:hypothetical protein BDD12DRAFT_802111 [Trichophaea hybrida]